MTTRRVLWPAGIGIVDEDLQRGADVASQADDAVMQNLMVPGGADGTTVIKRLRPLMDELRTPVDTSSGLGPYIVRSPRILACEAVMVDFATIGKVAVLPCAVDVFLASAAQARQFLALSGALTDPAVTPFFSSSVSGRVDTVYLTLRLNAPAEALVDRRMKDVTSGAVDTQNIAVYNDVEVTVHVAPGSEGSSTPGAVPADGTLSFNVAVATVSLPVGYTSGGTLLDGDGSFIAQVWNRSGIAPQAVNVVRRGTPTFSANCDAGPAGNRATILNASTRGTGHNIVRLVFRHTGANMVCVLDSKLYWGLRDVRVSIRRSVSVSVVAPFGNYVPPSMSVDGGASMSEDSGWVDSGLINTVSVGSPVGAFFTTSGPPVMNFFARNADGALVVTCADAPLHANGDFYTVIAECLDQTTEG